MAVHTSQPSTASNQAPKPAAESLPESVSRHEDDCLDEALEETFPASDPIAPHTPTAPGPRP